MYRYYIVIVYNANIIMIDIIIVVIVILYNILLSDVYVQEAFVTAAVQHRRSRAGHRNY